jgi:hypothetical protein
MLVRTCFIIKINKKKEIFLYNIKILYNKRRKKKKKKQKKKKIKNKKKN